jgi:hypothetical protein
MAVLRRARATIWNAATYRNGIDFDAQFPKTDLHGRAGGKGLAEEPLQEQHR